MFKEIVATYLFTKLLGKERAEKLGAVFQKYTIRIATIVFGFIAIAHSIRFALGIDILIAGWVVPLWGSLIVAIIVGFLAFGLSKMK